MNPQQTGRRPRRIQSRRGGGLGASADRGMPLSLDFGGASDSALALDDCPPKFLASVLGRNSIASVYSRQTVNWPA